MVYFEYAADQANIVDWIDVGLLVSSRTSSINDLITFEIQRHQVIDQDNAPNHLMAQINILQ